MASPFGTKASSQGINFLDVTSKHDGHLTAYFEEWSRRFNEESDPGGMISALEALVGHLFLMPRSRVLIPLQSATLVCPLFHSLVYNQLMCPSIAWSAIHA